MTILFGLANIHCNIGTIFISIVVLCGSKGLAFSCYRIHKGTFMWQESGGGSCMATGGC